MHGVPDLVGCQACGVFERGQRVEQVGGDGGVVGGGLGARRREQLDVVHKFFDNEILQCSAVVRGAPCGSASADVLPAQYIAWAHRVLFARV